MTKGGRLTWPLEPQKVLLKWVEQNKGPLGRLRQEYEAALQDALDELLKLDKEFPGFKQQPVADRRVKTEAKLKSLWSSYKLPKYSKVENATWNTTFFDEGLSALDREQLDSKFGDLLTSPTQNAADEDSAQNPGILSVEQLTQKRPADEEPAQIDEPTRSASPKRPKLTDTRDSSNGLPTAKSPQDIETCEDDTIDLTKGAQGALHSQGRRSDTPASDSDSDVNFIVHKDTAGGFNHTGTDTSVLGHPRPINSDRGTEAVRSQPAFLPTLGPDQQARCKRLLNAEITWDQLNDDGVIARNMDTIRIRIAEAVSGYLGKSDLPRHQPVVFDLELAYPDGLSRLLGLMLRMAGYNPEGRQWGFENFNKFHAHQQKQNLGYFSLFRSLIGCAVWIWVFEEKLDEDEFFKRSGLGAVQTVLQDHFDPVMVGRMKQRILEAHVNNSVVPDIRRKAEILAHRMLGYVEFLLPRTTTRLHEFHTIEVMSALRTDPEPKDGDGLPSELLEEAPARLSFRSDLVGVFEKAMTWNAEKLKRPFEQYSFSFPAFKDRFETQQMQWENKTKEHEEKVGTTILCLMPIVHRKTRKTVLGEFGPYSVVAAGTVIAN